MGHSYSHTTLTSDITNESEKSARNVLDVLAQNIRIESERNAEKHGYSLKGELWKAEFRGAHTQTVGVKKYRYSNPCYLDRKWNTNLLHDRVNDRDPCDGREKKRFSENEMFQCGSKIRDYKNENTGTLCAPPRRQHMCDKNLEALTVANTKNSNDLLGNILVTAKYEGDYIVNNHPNRGSSEVCIGLARSFADIGDIVRGKDMFKPNDKVENALREVFNNIYGQLENNAKAYYSDKDKSGNYYKLREDWWTANRDQVWKAITCSAPGDINYFRKISDGFSTFSSHGKCGHNEGAPPTNLDYVPQFLRWFEEWAEEFCRIRKDKLKKVKEVCRGEHDDKYCDGNGYDCTKTDLSRNSIFVDLDCPRCEEECTSYNEWIEKKIEEFSKQKKKYDKEIGKSSTFSNNDYDTRFYERLGKGYPSVNSFLEPLREGLNCSMDTVDGKIDYKKLELTFSPSSFCKTCPLYGVKCNNSTRKCTVNSNDKNTREIINDKNATHIDVEMIYHRGKNIKEDQKKLFQTSCLFRTIRNENWRCNVYNTLDVCRLNNFKEKIDPDEKIRFNVLIDRWLKDFVKGYYISKQKIEPCTRKENEHLCIISCKEKCTCVENWIKKKENEWEIITQYSNKKKHADSLNIVHKVRSYFDQIKSYVNKYIDDYDVLKKQGENEDCMDSDDCTSENKKNKNDFVIILLNRLKEKIKTCKTQHKENKNNNSCKTLRPHPPRRRHHHRRRRGLRSVRFRRPPPRQSLARSETGTDVPPAGPPDPEEHDEDEDDEDDENEVQEDEAKEQEVKDTEEEKAKETTQELPGPPATTPGVKPAPRPPQPAAPTQSACEIVDGILYTNCATDYIEGCRPKKDYKPWNCDKIKRGEEGACMPPRRQKLCVINLETFTGETTVDLREAFIKCAAIETHFLWKYYKEKNNVKYDKILESGYIPEDFKRMMYYTFGDYRDLCLDKNIGNDVDKVKKNINKVFNNSAKLGSQKIERETWWKAYGPHIWHGMLCALEKCWGKDTIKNNSKYEYNNVKFSDDKNAPTLEEFAKRPQFLRWFTEWSDEFCAQREEKEKMVERDCNRNYEGCANTKDNGNGNCVNACNKYKEYISGKQTQYEKQAKKFDIDKSQNKPGYEDYSEKQASEYLKEKCIKSSCNCMKKVTEISNYWTNPHKTYDTENLGIKCDCPPPPCEIVDAILGDKSSMGYREGCRKKYMTTRSGMGWLCNDKEGEKGKEDGLCIPPRRKRLYVKDLQDLTEEKSPLDLRDAFIKCAAVETFFAWHEYKMEKKTPEKQNGLVLPKLLGLKPQQKYPQQELESGEIPEEFKRQMFYSLGDYRDIIWGQDMVKGKDTKDISQKVTRILSGSKPTVSGKNGVEQRKQWWEKYGPEIWDGMICALSYDTEKKIKKENVYKQLTSNKKDKYDYKNVTFEGGINSDKKETAITTNLDDFVKRPQLFRWLEEWAHEFCTKRTHKLAQIKEDCRGDSDQNYCDGDGFDCKEIGPKEDETFSTFNCPSCAKSCKSYKNWINKKKKEFIKQEQKYQNKSKISDEQFYATLKQKYTKATDFLASLKGPCFNNNNEDSKINFKDTIKTFEHAKNCDPCPVFGVECKEYDCTDAKKKKYNGKTFITSEDIEKIKVHIEKGEMLVSDKGESVFPKELEDCTDTGIFKGITENKWSCVDLCESDVCVLKRSDEKKSDEENIQIRALFKRWIDNFLKDYNKINDKISQCMNNSDVSTCINGCEKKCNCVEKWIEKKTAEWIKIRNRYTKRYKGNDSEAYTVKRFLEGGPFDSDVQKAIKPFEKLINFEDSSECNDTTTSEKKESQKKDVVQCLLDKLQKNINDYKAKHKEETQETCPAQPAHTQTDNDTPDTDVSPDTFPPPFCNVPANPCGKPDATNVVNVEEVAKEIQQQRHKDMLDRSGKNSESKVKDSTVESVLRADASKGQYNGRNSGSELAKGNICNINGQYSNARSNKSNNPCDGKGDRLKIETQWKDAGENGTQIGVYLPPRRRHICTSNLEYLLHGRGGRFGQVPDDKASDSFLGDVLVAAKKEAEDIKSRLNNNGNSSSICRAMKYSFADIGDIIRGKDLWDHNDFKNLQNDLVTIFGKIDDELKSKLNDKYTGDEANRSYTQLRADWWEANRDQVWKAMQCPTSPSSPPRGNNTICSDTTPYDDYVPQRLRWMIEWAEWYCKYQSKAYSELRKGCEDCRSKVTDEGKGSICENVEKCKGCREKCQDYEKKIEPWKQQWEKIKEKYDKLYKKAESADKGDTTNDTTEENEVVQFLNKLQKQNSGNNIYSTAAGYVHQELPNMDCQKQTQFCEKKNGEPPTSEKDKGYAFREKPHDHDDKCDCTDKTAPQSKKPEVPPRLAPPPQAAQQPPTKPAEEGGAGRSLPPAAAGPSQPPRDPKKGDSEEQDDEDDDDDDDDEEDDSEEETEDGKGEEEEDEEEEDEVESDEDSEGEVEESEEETEEAEDTGRGEESPQPAAPAAPQPPTPQLLDDPLLKTALMSSTILWMVGIGFAALTYFLLKKKPKSPVDLIRVLDIHKGDYGMPTLKSKNRYIPYRSGPYKGKTYIYMEGDSSGDDDKYAFMSDTTDITSSESEYEEMDINDIYVPGSPKYKTLIEVVLEPSKRDTPSSDTPMNKFTHDEWNQLKQDFISGILENEQKDLPKNNISGNTPMNTQPNTLYFNKPEEKPFITSIHDRNLYSGEEYSYNIHMSTNSMDDIPISGTKDTYSGIDLINDSLNSNNVDIYDEVLKRKENELFGTNYKKNTSNNSVAKLTNSDPIMNQLDLLHKWLDRHRDMCEKWNNKEDILNKLNEEWDKDNDGINVPSDNRSLNTDVSIQIDIDENKGKKEFSNMDTNVDTPTMDNILDDLETCNEPFYDIYEDDIYYDVNDENPSVDDISMDHNRVDVPKKVHVEMKILNNTSTGSLEPEFPISDVWNI
ncbi:hypothetical protein C923_03710 [Plasmodium falciparum UGT5.1]|uniref:Erythrocyte membrane protein 1 n=2 Tax=Plasmodium falciparum TaxID=5833 RepID=W7JAD6_PLAFA|nr:hypothetical protein C923_03710 [Plasmodium falciparum UGT5.1]